MAINKVELSRLSLGICVSQVGEHISLGMRVFERSFGIYLTMTGIKKIIRYTEDFVIWRFVVSRFHCTIHTMYI